MCIELLKLSFYYYFFLKFFFKYIKLSKNSSVKSYQDNKKRQKRPQKRFCERYQSISSSII